MRAALLCLLVACAPRAQPGSTLDEDLAKSQQQPDPRASASVAPEPSPQPTAQATTPPPSRSCAAAPIAASHGVRTGTIDRARLVEVLDKGPGTFLRQFEVSPRLDGQRFVGWQLVQLLDTKSPLAEIDVAPCDVLYAVNGKPVSRPDQLQDVWDSLRASNELVAQLYRGKDKLELRFAIEPKVK